MKFTDEETKEIKQIIELLKSPDDDAVALGAKLIQTSKWYKKLKTSKLYVIETKSWCSQCYYFPKIFSANGEYWNIAVITLKLLISGKNKNREYKIVKLVEDDE